jgi:hypothetical protein
MTTHTDRRLPRAAFVLAWGILLVIAASVAVVAQAGTDPQPVTTAEGFPAPTAALPALSPEQALRRDKCAALWRQLYPWSYSPKLVDFFCGEHERAGMPDLWWHSLVYGASGSELRPSMICRGGGMVSRGLMDCSWTFAADHRGRLEPLLGVAKQLSGSRPWGPEALFDPWVSIRCHVLELACYRRQTGRDGWDLLRVVFLPASPDGARTRREQRRWLRLEGRHEVALARQERVARGERAVKGEPRTTSSPGGRLVARGGPARAGAE